MKVYEIIAVRDELTESFLTPTFAEDEKEALRLFEFQINNIPLWKDNASDYSLYSLGLFDSEKGSIKSNVKKIISGHSVLRKETKSDILDIKQTTKE